MGIDTHVTVAEHFSQAQITESDIRGHLVRIYSLVARLDQKLGPLTILELGTRGGNSTSALLAAVQTAGRGHVWSVDIVPSCGETFAGHPQWTFICEDSRNAEAIHALIGDGDEGLHVLFVDTEHDYEQVWTELNLYWPYMVPGGVVMIHDTETGPNCKRAVETFVQGRELEMEHYPDYNGLTVIRVPEE